MSNTDSKRKELKELDDLYRSFLIEQLRSGNLDIKDASQVVQYLKANEQVSEKERDTLEDEVKKKIEEANARRNKK